MKDLKALSEQMEKSVDEFMKNVGNEKQTATFFVHMLNGKYRHAKDGEVQDFANLLLNVMLEDEEVARTFLDISNAYLQIQEHMSNVASSN